MKNTWALEGLLLVGVMLAVPAHGQTTYEPYYFTLFAGTTGLIGGEDGTGSAAHFSAPQGMTVANDGTIYVTDTGNNTIRQISSTGVVATLAGLAGNAGSSDGSGANARFQLPQGVASDGNGNLYIADSANNTIRKIAMGGVVTTIAGAPPPAIGGYVDGPLASARFSYPIGIAVDAGGNIYVVDNGNDSIRVISTAGTVSTLAGLPGSPGSDDGTGSSARFNFATGMAYDRSANVLYVADTGNNTIRKITLGGVVTTVAGTPGVTGSADGTGPAASFTGPRGVSVDGIGNVYIAATDSHTIRRMTPAGAVTTLAGSPGNLGSADGVASHAFFNFPSAVASTATGHLYVADKNNHTIRYGIPAAEALSLTISQLPNGHKLLSGHAFPFVSVSITATNNLSQAFQPLQTVPADASGAFQYEDATPLKLFYRASAPTN